MENTNTQKLTQKSTKKRSLVDELSEDKELDKKIVKTFYSKNELSSDIFGKTETGYKMNEPIRDKLLTISDQFMEFLGIDFFIHDIVLTGSLANYNWSEYSDIDLHIIIDFDESGHNKDLLVQFFESKKDTWNNAHNIKIKHYDVEIYVQDVNEKHTSSGVYSILNNKWIIEPQKDIHKIDDQIILNKGDEYMKLIDNVIEEKENGENVGNEIKDIKTKLKRFRQSGLNDGGEYSYENLTFKLLRRNGYVKKLMDLKKDVSSKELSLNETPDRIFGMNAHYDNKDTIPFGLIEGEMVIGFNYNLIPQGLFLKIKENFIDKPEKIYGSNTEYMFDKDDFANHMNIPVFYEILHRLGIEKKPIDFLVHKGTRDRFWRTMYQSAGRLWYQKKLISFWEYPKNKRELDNILNLINKKMQLIYGTTLNFNEYSIEVRVDDENSMVKSVSDYKGEYFDSTEEELNAPHLLSPGEKEKHPQMQSVKQHNIERSGNIEKNWGSVDNRNHILNKNIAENKS